LLNEEAVRMRLIDAEELEKATCGRCKESKDGKWSIDCLWISCQWSNVMPVIQKLPIVDAQPVTHGEWIPSKMDAENKENAEMLGIDIEKFLSKAAYCSCCGIQQITNGRDKTGKALIHKAIYRYCPNCGAKMDE
jgi:ribosomal protein S27AE